MTCGGSSYVGSDQYKFARTSSDVALRPFLCADETNSIRPEYKLLGYFEEDNCSVIENHQYAENFECDSGNNADWMKGKNGVGYRVPGGVSKLISIRSTFCMHIPPIQVFDYL